MLEQVQRLRIEVTAEVSRGEYAGELLVPFKDNNGDFHVLHPDHRINGSAFKDDFTRIRGLKILKKYIEDGYGVRMIVLGTSRPPVLITAESLRVTVTEVAV